MKFGKHLFISYAHLDNQPVAENDVGWVSRFHRSLEAILSMRLGRKAEIWRDERLQGNDAFAQEILAQFPDTAALVAVVSPRYLKSEWCLREAHRFCEAAQQAGGLWVENKARIFKVVTLPVENQEALPEPMRETLGFDFFVRDPDGIEKELNPAYDPTLGPKLANECVRLAQNIAALVNKLEALPAADAAALPAERSAAPDKPVVYLAECSKDRRDDRTALRTELQMRGYHVVPEAQLPIDEDQYSAEVTRLLAGSALSVHLVGTLYGAVCDGESQQSVVELQNELAVQRARAAGLKRIVSLPEGLAPTDPRQQDFVKRLHGNAEVQFGADVIAADLEHVKSAVQAVLTRLENPPAPALAAPADAGGAMVYLVCDERDRKATVPLRRCLKEAGLDVQMPVFEGDAAGVRQANQERLAACDAVLVFYGVGTEAWKASVDSDLRKAAALRPGRPAPQVFTWLAEPPSAAKADCLDMGEANLIDALQGFSEERAAPLAAALRGAARG
ncbi:MAG: toll/interleukin-1 receptor domain-containing protein [Piscinibacter sp.]|nr:toll/interleukin-1 receptor domain-containing protein [Piscinibacter sp.]